MTNASLRPLRRLAVAAALPLLLAACTGGSSNGGVSSSDAGTDAAQLVQLRAEIEARVPNATALQQEILADGAVTLGEADRTAADVIACAEDSGVVVEAIWDETTSTMEFRTLVVDDSSEVVFSDCWRERFQLVGEMLAVQNALTPQQAADLERRMLECLRAAGVEAQSWPSEQDLPPEHLRAEATCYDEVALAGRT